MRKYGVSMNSYNVLYIGNNEALQCQLNFNNVLNNGDNDAVQYQL